MNNQTCKVYHWCKPGVVYILSDEDLQEIAMISTFEGKPTRSWR